MSNFTNTLRLVRQFGVLAVGGMLAGAAWADYVIVDLGTLGGTLSVASAINNNGDIVGSSSLPGDLIRHAFLYQDGVMVDIDQRNGINSSAIDINSSGQIVGSEWVTLGNNQPFLYSSGVMATLPIVEYYGGTSSQATAINDSGQIVGFLSMDSSNGYHQAYLYSNGVQTNLGTLGSSAHNSFAYAINNSGQIVGQAATNSGTQNPFRYISGVKSDLGSLGGTSDNRALDVNGSGQIVGISSLPNNSGQRAFLYSNGSMENLGTLGGNYSAAWAINTNGDVVGNSYTVAGESRAFIYSNGDMQNLNDLLPSASGWTLITASDINDSGYIVGAGDIDGERHGFLMAPGCN